MSNPDPLDNVVLTITALNGLEFAAAARDGRPLSTTDVVIGLIRADSAGAWEAVQLQTAFLEKEDAARFPDPRPHPAGAWHGAPLTESCALGFKAAVAIAADYHLRPLPPAVLALGLLTDPQAGACRALLASASVDHGQLLALVQDDVLDVTLEGFDPAQVLEAQTRGKLSTSARFIRSPVSASPTITRTYDWVNPKLGALGQLALEVEHLFSDPQWRELLQSALLAPEGLRQLDRGLSALEETPASVITDTARRRFDTDSPDPPATIVAATLAGSRRMREALRRIALSPRELAALVAEYRLRRLGDHDSTDRVFRTSIFNGLCGTVTSVLLIRAAAEGDRWWKLAFLTIVWIGYPQTGPMLSMIVAGILALAVAPLVGLVHAVAISADVLQARAERRSLLARTGVRVSLAETRRIKMRLLNKRGRQGRAFIQLQRALFRSRRERRSGPYE